MKKAFENPLRVRFITSIIPDSKFSSSGREDVDVRTLGRGRPFGVELLNPRVSEISREQVRNLEREINEAGSKLVFVRDLQVVARYEVYHY